MIFNFEQRKLNSKAWVFNVFGVCGESVLYISNVVTLNEFGICGLLSTSKNKTFAGFRHLVVYEPRNII